MKDTRQDWWRKATVERKIQGKIGGERLLFFFFFFIDKKQYIDQKNQEVPKSTQEVNKKEPEGACERPTNLLTQTKSYQPYQAKDTTSAQAIQVVNGLKNPDIVPVGKVSLDEIKYLGYSILLLFKLLIFDEYMTKLN